jgi:hypothetical protein
MALAVVTALAASATAIAQGALCKNSNLSQHKLDHTGKRDVMRVDSAHSIIARVCSCMPNVHRGDARRSGIWLSVALPTTTASLLHSICGTSTTTV